MTMQTVNSIFMENISIKIESSCSCATKCEPDFVYNGYKRKVEDAMQTKSRKSALGGEEDDILSLDTVFGIKYSLFLKEGRYTVSIDGGENGYCCLPDVARSFSRAKEILELLAKNEVSPINAAEVAEELLARDPSLLI